MPKIKLTHHGVSSFKGSDRPISYYDTVVRGLILRVSKAGTKTFSYRYRHQGRKKRFKIGRFPDISLSDARSRARELKVAVNDGNDPQAEKQKRKRVPDSIRFKKIVQEYKDRYLPDLRRSTQEEYKRIIDVEILPKLKNMHINEIEEYHIREILEAKAIKGKSPTMANRIRSVISSIFSFTQKNMGIQLKKDPIKNTKIYKSGENKRDRVYTEEEIRELWGYFVEFDEPIQSVFKMLLLTAQRKTETMHMKWEDIEKNKPYRRNRINENREQVSEAFLVDVWTIPGSITKNKQTHEVPFSKDAMTIVNKMREISGDCDYVFESPRKNNKPIEWIKSSVKLIKDTSNVPDFRIHDLRRTAATYMAEGGIDPMIIGKVLNHKGLAQENNITARYNRHNYMEKKRRALNHWAHRLNQILEGK